MVAACVGRLVLQGPRIAFALAAVIDAGMIALPFAYALTAAELGLAGLLACTTGGERMLGLRLAWLRQGLTQLKAALDADRETIFARVTPELRHWAGQVDDGAPGVHQRLRARANVWMNRFALVTDRPLLPEGKVDPRELRDVVAMYQSAAADLARFCARLPDDEPLRFGLSLIRAFIGHSWGDEALCLLATPNAALAAPTIAPFEPEAVVLQLSPELDRAP